MMLSEAAKGCHVSVNKSVSLEAIGYELDHGKYWLGLILEEPHQLWFGTCCRIDSGAAIRLGEGTLEFEDGVPGGYRWWRAGELESEQVHFYHRSKVGQLQWLEKFLHECLEMARKIGLPDQPSAPPDGPEE
jgi:hypothetical protein